MTKTHRVIAVLIAVLLKVAIESIWVTPAMTLLPIVLLSSPLVAMPRLAAVRLLALAVGFPLVALAVSPLAALGVHLSGVPNYGGDYRAVEDTLRGGFEYHVARNKLTAEKKEK